MNRLIKLTAALCVGLGLASGSARGAMTFDFSYQFSDGFKVTGSLEGNQNGEFIDNVSNVSVFFNGTPMTGTIYTAKLGPGVQWVAGAVVSFDVLKNNFIFVNGDLATGASYTEFFEILSSPAYPSNLADAFFASQYHPEDTTANSLWSLTPGVIPEPSTYLAGALLLLPFGASTIRILRKRRTA